MYHDTITRRSVIASEYIKKYRDTITVAESIDGCGQESHRFFPSRTIWEVLGEPRMPFPVLGARAPLIISVGSLSLLRWMKERNYILR